MRPRRSRAAASQSPRRVHAEALQEPRRSHDGPHNLAEASREPRRTRARDSPNIAEASQKLRRALARASQELRRNLASGLAGAAHGPHKPRWSHAGSSQEPCTVFAKPHMRPH